MNIKSCVDNKIRDIRIKGRFDFSIYQEFRQAYKDINPHDMPAAAYINGTAAGMLLLLNEHFAGTRIRSTHTDDLARPGRRQFRQEV